MSKKMLTIILCAAFVFCNLATAGLTVKYVGGDKVVYDSTNQLCWYPHLTNMIRMTKTQQYAYMAELNSGCYGGMDNWEFATLQQMMDLCDSMAETATEEDWSGPGVCRWPTHPDQFFEPTNYIGPTLPYTPEIIFTGRCADEWALREDLDGSVAVRWGQGEYHIPFVPAKESMRNDDDTNWVSDYTNYAPPPKGYPVPDGTMFEISAWYVAECPQMPQIPAPGAVFLASIGGGVVTYLRRIKAL